MKARTRPISLIALSLILASIRPVVLEALPQNQASQPAKGASECVTVDVMVLHRGSGKPIVGLNKQDFSIYEGDVKQEIAEFNAHELPASIVVLLDVSRSMDNVVKIIEGVKSAWLRFAPDDEVAIMTFAKNVDVVQGFTRDKQLIADRIGQIYASPGDEARGQTNLHEAIYQAAVYLGTSSSNTQHRFVLVISDSQPNQEQGHSKKQALQALFSNGGVLYGLIVSNSPGGDPLFAQALADYAAETGGLSAYAGSFSLPYIHKLELDDKLDVLIAFLKGRYHIAYRSANTSLGGKYRRIKVKVSPDIQRRFGRLVVVSRQGYYAQ